MPGICPGTGKIIAHGLQSPAGLFGLQTEGARKHVSAGKMPQRNATQRKNSPTDGGGSAGRTARDLMPTRFGLGCTTNNYIVGRTLFVAVCTARRTILFILLRSLAMLVLVVQNVRGGVWGTWGRSQINWSGQSRNNEGTEVVLSGHDTVQRRDLAACCPAIIVAKPATHTHTHTHTTWGPHNNTRLTCYATPSQNG